MRLLHYHEHPYDPSVQRPGPERRGSCVSATIAELNVRVGELFADACLAALRGRGARPRRRTWSARTARRSTITARCRARSGRPCRLATATSSPSGRACRSSPTSAARDIAAGGEGAPITPLADRILFAPRGPTARPRRRAVLNLGGIANLTVLDDDPAGVFGFDTGPANAPLDRLARRLSDGALACDLDGQLARLGPGQRAPPGVAPRGRPVPGASGPQVHRVRDVRRRLRRPRGRSARPARRRPDGHAHRVLGPDRRPGRPRPRPVEPPIDEIVVAGGGVKNPALLDRIRALVAPIPVRLSDDLGIPSDAREAMALAVLANATLLGHPMTTPRTTGAADRSCSENCVPDAADDAERDSPQRHLCGESLAQGTGFAVRNASSPASSPRRSPRPGRRA